MEEIELVNLRKKREKHFLQKNGDIIAKVYNEDIHYKKGDIYLEIDNNLVCEENIIKNKANNYNINFKKDDSIDFMKFDMDGNYINISILNGNIYKYKIDKNIIKYENVYNDIDFEYKLLSNGIKENIFLKTYESSKNNIEFLIDTNFELFMNENSIIFKSKNRTLKMDVPYMLSSDLKSCFNVVYELEKKDDKYILRIKLDDEWLRNVKYPVLIDPTITNISSLNSVYDTYIFPGDTNVNRNSQDILKVGVEKVNNQNIINRALIKFELPSITTGSQIVEATLDLIGYGYMEELYDSEIINVHQITADWTETSANWNDMNDKFNSRIEGYINSNFSRLLYDYNTNTYTLSAVHNLVDITNIVKKWYSSVPNYGLMLKANTEEYKSTKVPAFYSKNNLFTGNNPKPVLIIKYRNYNGFENYMDYISQMFQKGSTYLNTYNGNLFSVFDLGSTIGENLNANLKLIYNTNDVLLGNNYGLGVGYKFNFYQTIELINVDNVEYLKYLDEDGTFHYFIKKSNTIYEDEDGLGFTIESSISKYTLFDNKGNKLEFDINNNIGNLTKIINSYNKFIEITYSNNNIIKITDSNNYEINVSYTSNKITIECPNETIEINLLNNKILNIEYKRGIVAFDYNSNNLIEYITDLNNQKVKYEYYTQTPFRVKKIIQYGSDNSIGQYFNVEYGFDSTTIIDNKGKIVTKTFNQNGNIVSISNLKESDNIQDAYGISLNYGVESNNNYQYKNKILSNQVPIKYLKNYLSDSSFEYSSSGFAPEVGSVIFSNQARSGFRAIKLDSNVSTIKKLISVPKGKKYTFSVYTKNTGKISLDLAYKIDENFNVGNQCESSINDSWERESVTLFYPEEAITDLELSISLIGNGEAYIDDVQLEEGEVANNYNMIDDSNFELGLNSWIMDAYDKEIDDAILPNIIYSIVPVNLVVNALRIKMNPKYSSSISKEYNISGKQGDVYNISFWYKNDGLFASGLVGDPICNNVTINYDYIESGISTGQCTFQAPPLIPNNQNWQYYSASFLALEDFNSLKIIFYQDSNANDIYITNISLIKDIREVNYDYDSNGNMISISGYDNKEMNYNYDKNNQLIKTTEPMGSNFYYEYDNQIIDRVLSGISGTGISNKIMYDSFGNPIYTKIEKKINSNIESGLYQIRLKGKNKYFRIIDNQLVVDDENYNYDLWNVEIVDNYFRINHNIINNKYLSAVNDTLVATNYLSDNSLFELIQKENGSYLICLKQTDLSETRKYVKYDDSYNLSFSELVDNDYHYEFFFEVEGNKLFIENSVEYTPDGRFVKKSTNSFLNNINYVINNTSGLLESITDNNNNETSYNYDLDDRIISTIYNNKSINYMYSNNLLVKIYNDDIEYNLIYDNFENIVQVRIGNNIVLLTNEYELNNGNLISTLYGNLDEIQYTYDDFDRISTIEKCDSLYHYYYDNNGNLSKIISTDEESEFIYDMSQKLSKYRCKNIYNNTLLKIKYIYDNNGNIVNKKYELNGLHNYIENEVNADNSIITSIFDNNNISYDYDSLNRVFRKKINDEYTINYEYFSYGKRTSTILKSIDNNGDKYNYRYNKLGNIIHIYHNNILKNEYCYDHFNELILEKDYLNNRRIEYNYDSNGNILYKKIYSLTDNNLISENTYEYNNTNWCDQLTKYNTYNITYDNIGNPLTFGNIYFTWENGRQLTSISDSLNDISYSYNVSGIRTSKVVNNVRTVYCLEGSSIVFEKTGNDVIQYIRNDIDGLIGFKYNNQYYYYLKNAQDDIIALLNSNYEIIARYNYDSWGNILSITNSSGIGITDPTHVAYKNPFRYRSYYYDLETGLYYLNNRYYSPMLGRFINSDVIVGFNNNVFGYNLYAYCGNNPINRVDSFGNFSLRSITKKGANLIGNTFKKIGKKVEKVFTGIKNSFVLDLGIGFGADLSEGKLKAGYSNDKSIVISNGKIKNGNVVTLSAGVKLNRGKGIGVGKDYFHEPHRVFDSNNIYPNIDETIKHTQPFPLISDIKRDAEITTSYGFSTDITENTSVGENYDGDQIFIGIDFSRHILIGGHFKIGFNVKVIDNVH